jgi:hypothetical protein
MIDRVVIKNQRPDVESRITVGDLAIDKRDLLLIALRRHFLKPRYDIPTELEKRKRSNIVARTVNFR